MPNSLAARVPEMILLFSLNTLMRDMISELRYIGARRTHSFAGEAGGWIVAEETVF